MRITRQGDLLGVVRITGPSHNLLRLKLADTPGPLTIEQLANQGAEQLSREDVIREVKQGVDEEAQHCGVSVHAHTIQFLASDTRPASIYRELARAIVRHYVQSKAGSAPRHLPSPIGHSVALASRR